MKKIYLLLLLAFPIFVTAQSGDKITVLHYESPPLEETQPAVVNTPTAGITTTNSNEIGVTQGQLSVSLSGSANYTIPIKVPPGISGRTPEISINYNSQSGNGLAGFGWHIGGISTITRLPSTKYHDGLIETVNYQGDKFALDGQRLMLKSGVYGQDGAIYETENYSNIKITSVGSTTTGPNSFRVDYPDGSMAYFGSTISSSTRNEWSITYWQNPQGVVIHYIYDKDSVNNNTRISKILYGSLAEEIQINEIEFTYATRSRPESAYIGGFNYQINFLIKEIRVKSSGVGYRNYVLEHGTTSLGYQRLTSITESNGDNSKSYNPLTFSYDDTSDNISYLSNTSNLGVNNIQWNNSKNVTADFNGDGKMDFIIYPSDKSKYWLCTDLTSSLGSNTFLHETGAFEEILPTNLLMPNTQTGNYYLYPTTGWAILSNETSGLKFDFRLGVSALGISGSQYQFTINNSSIGGNIQRHYLSGDFNGDGLTDVVAIPKNFRAAYFINLDRRITTHSNSAGVLVEAISDSDKVFVVDFNGDGKSDILHFKSGKVYVYGLNQANSLVQLCPVFNDSAIVVNSTSAIMIGDYNGDGKIDFIIPKTLNSTEYSKFSSTGTGFVKTVEIYPTLPYTISTTTATIHYITTDYNNDGKTDLLQVTATGAELAGGLAGTGSIHLKCYINKNNTFTSASNSYITANTPTQSGLDRLAVPVFIGPDKYNPAMEFAIVRNNKVHYFKSQKDFGKEKLLRSIRRGNGVIESVTYTPLASCSQVGCYSYLADNNNTLDYPYYNVVANPGHSIVTLLEKKSMNTYAKQIYRYHGAITHLDGLGFIGFKTIFKSNWHTGFDNMISNITRFDILNRGIVTEDFSVAGDISVSSATPSLFINRSVFTNSTNILGNKVVKQKNLSKIDYNGIEGTSMTVNNTYDDYNNLTQSSYSAKAGTVIHKSGITNFVYDNNPTGSFYQYFIGRLKTKTTSDTQSGTTLTSEEAITYESNNTLPKKVIIKGHLTNEITYDVVYDNYGNITQKTLSTPGETNRVVKYEFDLSGRFMTKYTDAQNLSTNFTHYQATGLVATKTDPYGRTTSYEYDSWGKILKETDYLGKKSETTYQNTSLAFGLYETRTVKEDGSSGTIINDDLGRQTAVSTSNFDGTVSYIRTDYDHQDRVVRVSEPYQILIFEPSQTSSISYDLYGRALQKVDYTGKITTLSYNGLVTTVSENQQSKTITKNAVGDIVTLADPGGTISYTYYPDKNIKQANFGGNSISYLQDGWGRKTKVTDPTAGVYQYAYNGFGELKSMTTPKGTITYTLDDYGKLKERAIVGENSNSIAKYTYNSTTKLLTSIELNAGTPDYITYDYTYDNYNRLKSTLEWGYYSFYKEYVYDDFGRISKQLYNSQLALGNTFMSQKWIRNTYKNGYPWQIYDDTSNQLLWENTTANLKGKLTSGKFGNGYTLNNTYDQYGLIAQIKHSKTQNNATNSATFNTSFNAVTGNLISRDNNLFGTVYTEEFLYDNQDRLTEYTNAMGNQEEQRYDQRGRIVSNSLGQYNYDPAKIYRNSSIDLTEAGYGYYKNRAGVFYSGFEDSHTWTFPFYAEAPGMVKAEFDNTNKKSGNYSLKLFSDGPPLEGLPYTTSKSVNLNNTVATQYVFSGWVFCETGEASIILNMKNAVGNVTTSTKSTAINGDWVYIEQQVTIPANVKTIYFSLTKSSTDNTWFDDIRLVKLTDSNENRKLTGKYNVFNAPVDLEEDGIEKVSFSYNILDQRSAMYYGSTDVERMQRPMRRYYSSDGSTEVTQNLVTGVHEVVFYIGGNAYNANVILKSTLLNGAPQNYYYLHRDYLGSIVMISDQQGTVVEKREFDAWGNIKRFSNTQGTNSFTILDRGYTGHEHLKGLNLINMNGRIYDPVIHRFLQVDNYTQDPYNSQNYNPYAYVYNNPLRYVDPSGEVVVEGITLTYVGISIGATGIAYLADRWDEWGIKDFFNDNVSNAVKDAADWVGDQVRSVKRFFKRLFGRRSDEKPKIITINPQYSGFSGGAWQDGGFQSGGWAGLDKAWNTVSEGLAKVWNHPITRLHIPDFATIGVGFSGIAGVGGGTSIEANWVMRGPDASIIPVITVTQSVGGGFSVDATINAGGAHYLGSVKDIRRTMLITDTMNNGDFPTSWGSAGLSGGLNVSATGTYTPTATGYGIIGKYFNFGAGLPAGPLPFEAAGGVSNTIIIWQQEE